jgi:hypothetical protein
LYLPEDFPPLPSDHWLGASSLRERDDISLAVMQFLAVKPCDVMPDVRYRFVGFQGEGPNQNDPSRELVHRMQHLNPCIAAVSCARFGKYEGGMLVDSEQSAHGVVYFIICILKGSRTSAEVTVQEWPGLLHGGESFVLKVLQKGGKWKVVGTKPGVVILGLLGTRPAELASLGETQLTSRGTE